MANLFDIANLITSVGVDAVKIKPEPGLPEKSSNEILTELFSTFDADEGIVSPDNSDQQVSNVNVQNTKEDKLQGKKKKSKKKHKHKEKRHKKKSKRKTSSDSNSDADNAGKKKKKKHKKKSKRRHESYSSKSSDSDEPKTKLSKKDSDVSDTAKKQEHNGSDALERKYVNGTIKADDVPVIKKEPGHTEKTKHPKEERGTDSPQLPPIPKKIEDDFEEAIIPKLLEKSKHSTQGKILIKDLKNSIVYTETVKEIENKEKAKAARMEDGELSDSSCDNRTPTLSPTPPLLSRHDTFRSPSLSPTVDRIKSRPHSPLKTSLSSRNDLRLILREKEKKRLEVIEKCKSYTDKGGKDAKVHKAKNKSSKRSRSCHSRERNRSESQTRTSSHRSRSGEREKRLGRSRERARRERNRSSERRESGRSKERRRHKSRSRDRSREKYSRGRSRSKERKERIEIDKKKLLEIARRNAINMIKQGTLPLAQQDKAIAAIQAGGKTVDELTDFCKSLSKSEALGELSSISSEEDGSESEKGFHHPFLLKEKPSSIVMNIRNAKQLPTKTFQEKTAESSNQLRLQFPVSSGQHHRKTESEWIPVTPKKQEPKKTFVPASTVSEPLTTIPSSTSIIPVQPVQPIVFPQTPAAEPVDIGSIVSQRLAAMRKLRENPNDVCALNDMYRAQNEMRTWAESKQMPGQFTGSTGAKVLSPAELTSGYQAWARKVMISCEIIANYHQLSMAGLRQKIHISFLIKLGYLALVCIHLRVCYRHIFTSEKKQLRQPDVQFLIFLDQLVSAQPVSGGMGMALLQKMGWRPGEGLGKNKEGTLEPLQLEVKLDKRGLVSDQDLEQKATKPVKPLVPAIKTLEGKHPVSLLGEYCSKRKLGAPVYELCFECGPDHRKNFLFKVKVNGTEYKPSVASPNKKQAKAEAAQICLQTLGLLPS